MTIPSVRQITDAFSNTEPLMTQGSVHYSQSGEDIIVNIILARETERGVFVDFGAYHPFRFSNTFVLYLSGWRGVNVDANAEAIEEFRRIRPEDVNIHALLSDKVEELEYRRYAEGAYNTADPMAIEGMVKNNSGEKTLVGIDRFTTTTANQILEQHVGRRKFDFLNVDIEGLDEKILFSIDFTRFQPKIIATEIAIEQWNSEPMKSFFASRGYVPYSHCVHTAIFVRK